jgi:hypothetical protein
VEAVLWSGVEIEILQEVVFILFVYLGLVNYSPAVHAVSIICISQMEFAVAR